ncbi:MAG: hypothetical protein CVU29_01415 [Betaproteobacteria bacterium HGW-Betaproteobacteria-22]|nr:MAG: hypothetical protein CVU29_01415 [Betaproteobacteria bacterium HGW-Betaproteobacteria-22]
MTHTTYNAEWNSIAHLKPQLNIAVSVSREFKHGEFCYLLKESSTRHKQVINTAAYQFIGRCNGLNTVQHIWDEIQRAKVATTVTQQEVIALLDQLYGLDLLQLDSDSNAKSSHAVKSISGYMLKLGAPLSFLSTIFVRR